MKLATLPDVAAQNAHETLQLDWVGMCGIALPVLIDDQRVQAKVDAGVSLDDGASRGIHMSRLFLALEMLETETLTPGLLCQLLQRFLDTHEGLSQRSEERRVGKECPV